MQEQPMEQYVLLQKLAIKNRIIEKTSLLAALQIRPISALQISYGHRSLKEIKFFKGMKNFIKRI